MWKEILSGLAQMNTAAYQNMKTASFDAVFKKLFSHDSWHYYHIILLKIYTNLFFREIC